MGRSPNTVKTITPETYLTSHECGAMLQCNPSSINKWVKEGKIPAHTTPGGHRRIRAVDLITFLTTFKMPVPATLAHVAEPPLPPPPTKPAKTKKKK